MNIITSVLHWLVALMLLTTNMSSSIMPANPTPEKDTPAAAVGVAVVSAVGAVTVAGLTAVGAVAVAVINNKDDKPDSGDDSGTETDSDGTTTTTTTTTTTNEDGTSTTTTTTTTTTSDEFMPGPNGEGDMRGGGEMGGPWFDWEENFVGTITPSQGQVRYESLNVNADVKQADKSVNEVMITRDRQIHFQMKDTGTQARVPIQIEIDRIMLSTKDIPNTFGSSSFRIVVAVEGKTLYEFSAMVAQGQLPEVTKNAQFGDISLNRDELVINDLSSEVMVDLSKDQTKVTVSLITEGIGRRI